MRTRVWAAGMIAGLLLLSGCTGAAEPPVSTPQETTTAADPEAVVATRTVTTNGGEIEVRLHPLVQIDDYVVLTADLVALEIPAEEQWLSGSVFGLDVAVKTYAPVGMFRLVDAHGLRIHLPALDADGKLVGTKGGSFVVRPEGLRVQQVYAAPADGTQLGLLLPGDYIDELPLVKGDLPAPTLDGAAEKSTPIDIASIVSAPVTALDSITRQLDGTVKVIESTEQVQIDLSGDVLFEFGSAELSPDATSMIDAAAKVLNTRGSGKVDVVGHTDDIGDDSSNQTLSEQRAAAAAHALAEHIDTAVFHINAEGRGETEPLVENGSDANRQLNRRVTLTLTTEDVTRSEIPSTGDLPPFDKGPVATGAAGFDDDSAASTAGTLHLSAPAARRVGGMLVVTVEAKRTDNGEYEVGWAFNLAARHDSYRGAGTSMEQWPFSPRLLVGDTAVYPFDYTIGTRESGTKEYRIAGDNDAQQSASAGQTLRFVALYPDVAGADRITLENSGTASATNFRLTDIPVD